MEKFCRIENVIPLQDSCHVGNPILSETNFWSILYSLEPGLDHPLVYKLNLERNKKRVKLNWRKTDWFRYVNDELS